MMTATRGKNGSITTEPDTTVLMRSLNPLKIRGLVAAIVVNLWYVSAD